MRRPALALAGVAALLVGAAAWFVLRGPRSAGPDADDGAGAGSADAQAEIEAVRARDRQRARLRPGEAPDEQGLTPFAAQWPQIGQDREQDPALGAIRGRVLAAPEVPAREAVVESSVQGDVTARARVRSDGVFLLRNVPPGKSIALAARAPDFAPGGFDKLVLAAGQTLDVGALYLGAALDPDATNRVEVRVTSGGRPLANALVTATSGSYASLVAFGSWEKQPGGTVVRARTGESGSVVFEKLPPAFYDVFAEAEGMAFVARPRQMVQRDTQATVTVDLGPGLTIEGKVVDDAGQPIAGVRLGAFRFGGGFTVQPSTSTGDDGKFVLDHLGPGSYWIFAAKAGRGQKDVQSVEAGTKDLTIQIPLGGEVALRVVDAATGAPVKEFAVRPFRNQPFAYLFAPRIDVKADDGIWRQQLERASWGVEVSARGYALRTLALVPQDAPAPVEVRLEGSGVLHGRVVARDGGGAVRGARIFVKRGGLPPSPVKDLQSTTDGNGEFVLDCLARQPVKVTVSHVDHTEQTFDVEPAPRGEGGALPPAQELQLGSGGRVQGHAYGPGRVPLAGQQVTLMKGFDFTGMRQAAVAADGAYEFRHVPPDKYALTLGQTFGGGGRQRSEVEVVEGGVVTVDFGAETGGQRVAGRVLRGEVAVAGVGLTLDGGAGATVRATSDAQGRFAFENVQPGRYVVRPTFGSTASVEVAVAAEEPPAEVTLALPSVGSIEGRILDDATGQPLSGGFVSLEQTADAQGSPVGAGRAGAGPRRPTAADGAWRADNLEPGTYTVRAYRDPFGSEVVDDVVLGPGEAKSGVEIRMGGAGTLSGVVRNAAGQPIEGAAVQIRDAQGRRVFFVAFANSSADGAFTQGALRPGEYDVTLEKDGYAPATQRVAIAEGKETKSDFTLLAGGRIEISARRADGTAAAGATAAVFDAQGRRVERGLTLQNFLSGASARTDANGQLTLRGLAAGRYRVDLSLDGATASAAADVVEGGGTAVEIVFSGP